MGCIHSTPKVDIDKRQLSINPSTSSIVTITPPITPPVTPPKITISSLCEVETHTKIRGVRHPFIMVGGFPATPGSLFHYSDTSYTTEYDNDDRSSIH